MRPSTASVLLGLLFLCASDIWRFKALGTLSVDPIVAGGAVDRVFAHGVS